MITAPTRDNKAATSTPVNIAVVHATQRARGVTIRTTPNRVKRMSGTVHIYLPCLPNLKVQPRESNCPLADPTPPPLAACINLYIPSTYRRGIWNITLHHQVERIRHTLIEASRVAPLSIAFL